MGRFTTPDPSGLLYADLTDPQSLNLYDYVHNNPMTNFDPNGLCAELSDQAATDPGRGDLPCLGDETPGGAITKPGDHGEPIPVPPQTPVSVPGGNRDPVTGNVSCNPSTDVTCEQTTRTIVFRQRITFSPHYGFPANNGMTQQQKQTDCIKAANKKFVSGMQGPGAWDSFKRAQPSVPKTLFTWGASGLRTWSWSGDGLTWSYAVNVLWNGGQQMIDYVKQASAVNSQYDAEIAACK